MFSSVAEFEGLAAGVVYERHHTGPLPDMVACIVRRKTLTDRNFSSPLVPITQKPSSSGTLRFGAALVPTSTFSLESGYANGGMISFLLSSLHLTCTSTKSSILLFSIRLKICFLIAAQIFYSFFSQLVVGIVGN